MHSPEIRAALGSARSMIDQQLSTAFIQLEAATGAVETRKILHAAFIRQAILTAGERLPDNDALFAAIDEALTALGRMRASRFAPGEGKG